jgi:hypothetical protein
VVCTGCGAEAIACCDCGVSYVPKSVRAAEAIKANPRKSDRAIAVELGIHNETVSRARRQVSHDATPQDSECLGRDGKSYSIRQRVADDPEIPPQFSTPRCRAIFASRLIGGIMEDDRSSRA